MRRFVLDAISRGRGAKVVKHGATTRQGNPPANPWGTGRLSPLAMSDPATNIHMFILGIDGFDDVTDTPYWSLTLEGIV